MAAAIPSNINHFRPDVEGMRAIAVLMVLLYHAGIGWASGGFAGVDVFFVISGFLITGLLVKELERDGRISLLNFYARRAKRLFPAAATVIVATAVLAWLTLPVTRWRETGGDLIASSFYFINWRLAHRSVDYLAEDAVPSFAQHFWSLAVEEQYYIIWPILLVLAFWLLHRFLKTRTLLWALLGLVAIPSLLYSVYLTQADPGPAYFVTTTRMWELAIGGAVALGAGYWQRLSSETARLAGWLGLLMVVASLLFVSNTTPWPGYAAALPTLGTALMIIGGYRAGESGPIGLLGLRPLVWLGGISYSLYLWHWPLIEATKAWQGHTVLPVPLALSVIAVSIVMAWLTWKFIENPIRFSGRIGANNKLALTLGLAFSLIGAAAGAALVWAANSGSNSDAKLHSSAIDSGPTGALSLPGGKVPEGSVLDTVEWMLPLAANATQDVPDAYAQGCQVPFDVATPRACRIGDPNAPTSVAVVGDSKIVQWLPALELIAKQHHLRLTVYGKSACGFNSRRQELRGRPYDTCYQWNREVHALLTGQDKHDYLITSQGGGRGVVDPEEVQGLLEWWQPLVAQGTKIIAIANNPNPGTNVYECVALNPDKLSECAFTRKPPPATASLRAATEQLRDTNFVDLNDAICSSTTCPAVIGNALVYRQGSHLTRTDVLTMTNLLEGELKRVGLLTTTGDTPQSYAEAVGQSITAREDSSLPEQLAFNFNHTIELNRQRTLDNGLNSHRIRLKFYGTSHDQVLASLISQLEARNFRSGRTTTAEDGSTRLNLRRDLDGRRVAIQLSKVEHQQGQLYISFVDAPTIHSSQE